MQVTQRQTSASIVVTNPFVLIARGEVDGVLQITERRITELGATERVDTMLALELVESRKAAWPDSDEAAAAIAAANANANVAKASADKFTT